MTPVELVQALLAAGATPELVAQKLTREGYPTVFDTRIRRFVRFSLTRGERAVIARRTGFLPPTQHPELN